MTEVDNFIALVVPRMTEMDQALHNGDAGPRKAFLEPPRLLGLRRIRPPNSAEGYIYGRYRA